MPSGHVLKHAHFDWFAGQHTLLYGTQKATKEIRCKGYCKHVLWLLSLSRTSTKVWKNSLDLTCPNSQKTWTSTATDLWTSRWKQRPRRKMAVKYGDYPTARAEVSRTFPIRIRKCCQMEKILEKFIHSFTTFKFVQCDAVELTTWTTKLKL